jgi:hypothetical protein
MKLIQILLPVRDNRGRKFKRELYAKVHRDLAEKFGGVTAYTRSPACGLWKSEGSTKSEDMVIVEVMAGRFSRGWWTQYRRALERLFHQDEIVMRAQDFLKL